MLPSDAVKDDIDLTATQTLARNFHKIARKKIWLPKLLYDILPWFYLLAGLAAFFAALYVSEWFWVVPHYLLFSAACLHLAYTVYRWRRRQDSTSVDDTIVTRSVKPRR